MSNRSDYKKQSTSFCNYCDYLLCRKNRNVVYIKSLLRNLGEKKMMINKYRAWVKSEKRYIVDTQDFIPLIVTNKGVMKLQPQFEKNYYEILPLDWFIIEQFTGLHDKNGVEIYEGDICMVSLSYFKIKNEKATVIFRNGSFQFQYGCEQFFSKPHDSWDEVEVIGNIHERSEDNEYYM